ncbi:hypothetical protein [Acinetobacter bouvetii]|nr:hypothetical protein [Acinetobacter bouvetii]
MVLGAWRFIPASQFNQEPEQQHHQQKANNSRAQPDQYPNH